MASLAWKCVHGATPAYLGNLSIPTTSTLSQPHLQSAVTGTTFSLYLPCYCGHLQVTKW